MRVGIIFNSRYGQTEKIARRLADELRAFGDEVELKQIKSKAGTPPPLESLDAVLIGSPIYAGKFRKEMIKWAQANRRALESRTLGFFSVGMNAADARPNAGAEDDRMLRRFIDQTGIKPHFMASFIGALHYRKYNFFIRYLMKRISASAGGPTDTSRDWELTNWDEVTSFAKAFHTRDRRSQFATERRFALAQVSEQRPSPIYDH